MRWVEHLAHMGEIRNAYKILAGRHRCTWENNVIMNLTEIGCEDVEWIHLTEDRVLAVSSCKHFQVP
jgi:hypothetical protein